MGPALTLLSQAKQPKPGKKKVLFLEGSSLIFFEETVLTIVVINTASLKFDIMKQVHSNLNMFKAAFKLVVK